MMLYIIIAFVGLVTIISLYFLYKYYKEQKLTICFSLWSIFFIIEFFVLSIFGYIIETYTQIHKNNYIFLTNLTKNATYTNTTNLNNTINILSQNFKYDDIIMYAIVGLCFIVLVNALLLAFAIYNHKNRDDDY